MKSKNEEKVFYLKNKQDNLDSNNNDPNKIFFEKFSVTKRDLKNKKSKKNDKKEEVSLITSTKGLSLSKKLESKQYLFKIYLIILLLSLIVIAFSIAVFSLLVKYYGSDQELLNSITDSAYGVANYCIRINPVLAQTTVIFSAINFSIIFLPYLFLISSWFVGINQVFSSKKFILINLGFLGFVYLLTILVVIFFSVIYSNFGILPIATPS